MRHGKLAMDSTCICLGGWIRWDDLKSSPVDFLLLPSHPALILIRIQTADD